MKFGTDTYRAGALERINDATALARGGRWVGAVYSAGLSVEGMLRSLVWLRDRRLDERHDLRRLAVRIDNLGLLRRGERDAGFVSAVQDVALRWNNGLRFAAAEQLVRFWNDVGYLRNPKRGLLGHACDKYIQECADVVQRCEVLWQQQRRN